VQLSSYLGHVLLSGWASPRTLWLLPPCFLERFQTTRQSIVSCLLLEKAIPKCYQCYDSAFRLFDKFIIVSRKQPAVTCCSTTKVSPIQRLAGKGGRASTRAPRAARNKNQARAGQCSSQKPNLQIAQSGATVKPQMALVPDSFAPLILAGVAPDPDLLVK